MILSGLQDGTELFNYLTPLEGHLDLYLEHAVVDASRCLQRLDNSQLCELHGLHSFQVLESAVCCVLVWVGGLLSSEADPGLSEFRVQHKISKV